MEQRPCFTFVRDWFDCIDVLPEESQGRLYRALVRFGLNFTEPEFTDPMEASLWRLLRKQALYGWQKHVAGKGAKKMRMAVVSVEEQLRIIRKLVSAKMNRYALVILDYAIDEVKIMSVDNDIIEKKWNDDVLKYITGDIAKGGLGYDLDQIEYLYSDEVYFDIKL